MPTHRVNGPNSRVKIYRSRGQYKTMIGDFSRWLMGHAAFHTSSSNFAGGPVVGSVKPGQHGLLKGKARGTFDDMADAIDYIVMSYDTPIAWHDRNTKTWVLVSNHFSPATTQHQAALLFALCDCDVRKMIVSGK